MRLDGTGHRRGTDCKGGPSPDRHGREGGARQATGGGPTEEEGSAGNAVAVVTWLLPSSVSEGRP